MVKQKIKQHSYISKQILYRVITDWFVSKYTEFSEKHEQLKMFTERVNILQGVNYLK